MDADQFDHVSRSFADPTRRKAISLLLGGLATAVGISAVDAKKKKKRKKNKGSGSSGGGPAPGGSPAPVSPPPGVAPGTVLATFDITLQGQVSGWGFQRAGVLRLVQPYTNDVPNNGPNPVDVCVTSGNPGSSPSTGALFLGSNSACFGGTAKLDLGRVSLPTSQQILFEPVPGISGICINGFNVSSGTAAPIYTPYTGGMLLELRSGGQTVVGIIETRGRRNCYEPVDGSYVAQFAGQRR